MICTVCDDTGWVCETHPGRPWQGPRACPCGGASAPCPRCNIPVSNEPPRMPTGFKADRGEARPSPAETIDQRYHQAIRVIGDYLERRIEAKTALDRLISVLDDDDLREAITEVLVDAKVHPRPS